MNKLKLRTKTIWNYAYYPVIFKTEAEHLKTKARLKHDNINSRRYFYPSLEDLPYADSNNCPISKELSKKVLCLPLFVGLELESVEMIIKLSNNNLKY